MPLSKLKVQVEVYSSNSLTKSSGPRPCAQDLELFERSYLANNNNIGNFGRQMLD